MISNSTTQPVRFTPQWLDGQPDAPVYFVRAGSVNDRDALEAELAGPPFNAGSVWPHELREAVDDGARTILSSPDDLARVLSAVASVNNGEGTTADTLLVRELESSLADVWPPYADLLRRQVARQQRLPTLAARRFLRGWEGVAGADGNPLPFETGIDGMVRLETLGQLPPLDLKAVGIFAYNLLYPDAHRPLSVPPSKSAAAPVTSRSGGKPRTAARAGKSAARSTPKTPR